MSLSKLIEAVEAGVIAAHDTDAFIPISDDPRHIIDAQHAYRGSLDAAKSLHDALLPDHRWTITPYWASADMKISSIWAENTIAAKDDNPARAWLLAILRALEQEGRDG